MSEQNEVTNQEVAQYAIAAAAAERQSYLFMKRHIADFSPCEANSSILTAYIQRHELPWTEDSLEQAYAACKNQLVPAVPADRPPLDLPDAPDSNELPPAPAGAIWPTTKKEIRLMSKTDYSREYHSPQTGAAFRARVTAVLQRGL